MIVLGIETSCDDTSVSVLKIMESGGVFPARVEVASLVTSSQTIHTEYGGVVPVLAAREHEQELPRVLEKALSEAFNKKEVIPDLVRDPGTHYDTMDSGSGAGMTVLISEKVQELLHNIDLIVVTRGPGLAPALKRGVNFAKELATELKIPLVGANHMEGHLYSGFLDHDISGIKFPILHLVVSGGHTELVLMSDHGKYEYLGRTLDDAVGEAYDKVARMIGLPYPGGPEIERAAKDGDSRAFDFPRPMMYSKNYNFSFAGLKTAVLYAIEPPTQKASVSQEKTDIGSIRNDIAASFQAAVVETLLHKTKKAVEEYQPTRVMVSGGVSLNSALRDACESEFDSVTFPEARYTGDNAAMVALAGYVQYRREGESDISTLDFSPKLNLK